MFYFISYPITKSYRRLRLPSYVALKWLQVSKWDSPKEFGQRQHLHNHGILSQVTIWKGIVHIINLLSEQHIGNTCNVQDTT